MSRYVLCALGSIVSISFTMLPCVEGLPSGDFEEGRNGFNRSVGSKIAQGHGDRHLSVAFRDIPSLVDSRTISWQRISIENVGEESSTSSTSTKRTNYTWRTPGFVQ